MCITLNIILYRIQLENRINIYDVGLDMMLTIDGPKRPFLVPPTWRNMIHAVHTATERLIPEAQCLEIFTRKTIHRKWEKIVEEIDKIQTLHVCVDPILL